MLDDRVTQSSNLNERSFFRKFSGKQFSGKTSSKRCLVIQPLPGIRDALWHLQAFKALARQSPLGKITLLAKPQSQVDKLLAHEPWVEEVLWLDPQKHFGSMGALNLGRELKEKAFEEVWILHHSARYYIAASFAGIPKRHGYGFGWLKGMLTSSKSLEKKRYLHSISRFKALLQLYNLSLKPEDSFLTVQADKMAKIQQSLSKFPRPWTVLGFGATNPIRIWPPERFADLAVNLQNEEAQTIFLCGAKAEEEAGLKIQSLIREKGFDAELATRFDLGETCALLSQCDRFIGNDSGLLNLAGSLDKKAIGLFGKLGVLEYDQSVFDQVLENERGRKSGGMALIGVKDVLDGLKKIKD